MTDLLWTTVFVTMMLVGVSTLDQDVGGPDVGCVGVYNGSWTVATPNGWITMMLLWSVALVATSIIASAGAIFILRGTLLKIGCAVIDAIVAGVLGGPRMTEAIVHLVAGILEHPRSESAISHVVSGVLQNTRTRSEISNVVVAVLGDEHVKESILDVVAGVLSRVELEKTIADTVKGVLSNQSTAHGIAGVIKGTSHAIVSDASAFADEKLSHLPSVWPVTMARRRLGHVTNQEADSSDLSWQVSSSVAGS